MKAGSGFYVLLGRKSQTQYSTNHYGAYTCMMCNDLISFREESVPFHNRHSSFVTVHCRCLLKINKVFAPRKWTDDKLHLRLNSYSRLPTFNTFSPKNVDLRLQCTTSLQLLWGHKWKILSNCRSAAIENTLDEKRPGGRGGSRGWTLHAMGKTLGGD